MCTRPLSVPVETWGVRVVREWSVCRFVELEEAYGIDLRFSVLD
jgi:hypothetical protein